MKWRSALRPVAAVSLKSPVKESPSAFQSATAWTARGGAAAPLQRRRDGQRRELCSLADQKRGSVWLTAATRRLTSSALIAARRSHTSSKAGPAWSQCPSAHLRTPPSLPAPKFSVYEHRKHPWVMVLCEDVEHSSTPSVLRNPGSVKPASYAG